MFVRPDIETRPDMLWKFVLAPFEIGDHFKCGRFLCSCDGSECVFSSYINYCRICRCCITCIPSLWNGVIMAHNVEFSKNLNLSWVNETILTSVCPVAHQWHLRQRGSEWCRWFYLGTESSSHAWLQFISLAPHMWTIICDEMAMFHVTSLKLKQRLGLVETYNRHTQWIKWKLSISQMEIGNKWGFFKKYNLWLSSNAVNAFSKFLCKETSELCETWNTLCSFIMGCGDFHPYLLPVLSIKNQLYELIVKRGYIRLLKSPLQDVGNRELYHKFVFMHYIYQLLKDWTS